MSIISHDLKTPFNALLGFSEILLDDWDQIEADEHMVNSLVRNLLSNAIKFSPNGSTVDIKANIEGQYLVCHVEDHGTGISDEKTGQVFSDNVSVAGTNQEESTGLGLQLFTFGAIFEMMRSVQSRSVF